MKLVKKFIASMAIILGIVITVSYSENVSADTYNVGNYTITEDDNIISVTDQETGLSAYLDRSTGMLTDIDGTVSYVDINNEHDYIPSTSISTGYSIQATTSGFKSGVWNYVTTNTYNLGYVQSVQSFVLGLIAFLPSPASPYISAASLALGGASLVNQNVTVKVTQYYDPAQPSKIKEVVVTYANGKRVGSTSYVRNIF